jgi:hypothetical protein
MELLFFIVFVGIIAFLFCKSFNEFDWYTIGVGSFIGCLVYLLVITVSASIPVQYEYNVVEEYRMLPIYENGEVTNLYYKLEGDGRIKIDIGESITINPSKIVYGSEYKLEEVEYTWDDNQFPYNLFPTASKSNGYILYLKESE